MHGLPILSTERGIRGLTNYDTLNAIMVEKAENFRDAILKLADSRESLKSMAENVFAIDIINSTASILGL